MNSDLILRTLKRLDLNCEFDYIMEEENYGGEYYLLYVDYDINVDEDEDGFIQAYLEDIFKIRDAVKDVIHIVPYAKHKDGDVMMNNLIFYSDEPILNMFNNYFHFNNMKIFSIRNKKT